VGGEILDIAIGRQLRDRPELARSQLRHQEAPLEPVMVRVPILPNTRRGSIAMRAAGPSSDRITSP
jgi:hypothetical protein